MDFLSSEYLSALLAIIVIDLVLAGDNAIVIGLAARRLPKEQQKESHHLGNYRSNRYKSCCHLSCCLVIKNTRITSNWWCTSYMDCLQINC